METLEQRVWIEAARVVGADPEDHMDDELIQPIYDKLMAAPSKAISKQLRS